MFNNSFLTSLQ